MNFSKLDRETIINLLDSINMTTFRVLYASISIPKNIPRYICSNNNLSKVLEHLNLEEAFLRRMLCIDLGDTKLYKT